MAVESKALAAVSSVGHYAALARVPEPSVIPSDDQAPRHAEAPWDIAADAGIAIGRESRKAAVKTADAFTRLGRSVGRAFR
jgi:hypothetical protein